MSVLAEVLESIPGFHNADVVRQFATGPICDKWLLQVDGQQVVLRQDRPLARKLGLNRANEIRMITVLAERGWAAPVVWADVRAGQLITEFVPGVAWSAEELHLPGKIEQLAGMLRELHRLPVDGPEFDLASRLRHYAKTIATSAARADVESGLQELESLSVASNGETGLIRICHNDPVAGNVICGEKLSFIDWEYAGVGNPLFDLAALIEHHKLSAGEQARLESAYFGAPTAAQRADLKAWRGLYRLSARLWNAIARQ
jgi:aminoglycoside phosphotransferase (APT) family kinase protein